jgi:hypothetical protein
MSDPFSVIAAVASAIATALAAYSTWYAPRAAAVLSEALRRDAERAQERQRSKFQIFTVLMQERAAIYSENAVKSLNLIDIVFNDSREVCDAWSELFSVFSINPLPAITLDERLRKLLTAMAMDIGIGGNLRAADFSRVYSPRAIEQDRLIRDLQRQQMLNVLQGQGSPAANTAATAAAEGPWPPKPE